MRKIILNIIRFYRKHLAIPLGALPVTPFSCRYIPTCSEYTYQAVEKYGTIMGLLLGFKRILRCNPFGGSGSDPLK